MSELLASIKWRMVQATTELEKEEHLLSDVEQRLNETNNFNSQLISEEERLEAEKQRLTNETDILNTALKNEKRSFELLSRCRHSLIADIERSQQRRDEMNSRIKSAWEKVTAKRLQLEQSFLKNENGQKLHAICRSVDNLKSDYHTLQMILLFQEELISVCTHVGQNMPRLPADATLNSLCIAAAETYVKIRASTKPQLSATVMVQNHSSITPANAENRADSELAVGIEEAMMDQDEVRPQVELSGVKNTAIDSGPARAFENKEAFLLGNSLIRQQNLDADRILQKATDSDNNLPSVKGKLSTASSHSSPFSFLRKQSPRKPFAVSEKGNEECSNKAFVPGSLRGKLLSSSVSLVQENQPLTGNRSSAFSSLRKTCNFQQNDADNKGDQETSSPIKPASSISDSSRRVDTTAEFPSECNMAPAQSASETVTDDVAANFSDNMAVAFSQDDFLFKKPFAPSAEMLALKKHMVLEDRDRQLHVSTKQIEHVSSRSESISDAPGVLSTSTATTSADLFARSNRTDNLHEDQVMKDALEQSSTLTMSMTPSFSSNNVFSFGSSTSSSFPSFGSWPTNGSSSNASQSSQSSLFSFDFPNPQQNKTSVASPSTAAFSDFFGTTDKQSNTGNANLSSSTSTSMFSAFLSPNLFFCGIDKDAKK